MPPPISKTSVISTSAVVIDQPRPLSAKSSKSLLDAGRDTVAGSFCGRTVSVNCVVGTGIVSAGAFCVGATVGGFGAFAGDPFSLGLAIPCLAAACIGGGADVYALTERLVYLEVTEWKAARSKRVQVTPETSTAGTQDIPLAPVKEDDEISVVTI